MILGLVQIFNVCDAELDEMTLSGWSKKKKKDLCINSKTPEREIAITLEL